MYTFFKILTHAQLRVHRDDLFLRNCLSFTDNEKCKMYKAKQMKEYKKKKKYQKVCTHTLKHHSIISIRLVYYRMLNNIWIVQICF